MARKPSDKLVSQGSEKRLFLRARLRARVVFEDETGEGFIYFYSTDISEGGVFLESDIPLKVGTRVFLSFSLRDGESPIRAIGRVVRVEKDANHPIYAIGMGVQFVDLSDAFKEKIRKYIEEV